MNVRELADIVLPLIHEEMDFSVDEPWSTPWVPIPGTERVACTSVFASERICDTLHVTHCPTGKKFVVERRT